MFGSLLTICALLGLGFGQPSSSSCGPFTLQINSNTTGSAIGSFSDGSLTGIAGINAGNATGAFNISSLPGNPPSNNPTSFYIFSNGSLSTGNGSFCHAYPHFRCNVSTADTSTVSIATNGSLVFNNNAFWYLGTITSGYFGPNGTGIEQEAPFYLLSGYYGTPNNASLGVGANQRGGFTPINLTASGCFAGHSVNGSTAPTPTGSGAVTSAAANESVVTKGSRTMVVGIVLGAVAFLSLL